VHALPQTGQATDSDDEGTTGEQERDDDIITVILPEFVTDKWWTRLLHGQNGFLLKWALLFRKGVVVTNIRYYLEPHREAEERHPLTSTLDSDA